MEEKFELIVDWEERTLKLVKPVVAPMTEGEAFKKVNESFPGSVRVKEEPYVPKPGGFVQQARAAVAEPKRDQLDHIADLARKGQWGEAEWKKITYYANPETGKESYAKSIDDARKTAEFYKGKGWSTTKKFGQWIKNGEALNQEIMSSGDGVPFPF